MYHDLMNIFLPQLSKIIIVSFSFCCIFERELRTNRWLFKTKILAGYQDCHMTCHLETSSLNLRLDKKSQKLQSFTILRCPPIYLHLIIAIPHCTVSLQIFVHFQQSRRYIHNVGKKSLDDKSLEKKVVTSQKWF